jgi:hypothetical protein
VRTCEPILAPTSPPTVRLAENRRHDRPDCPPADSAGRCTLPNDTRARGSRRGCRSHARPALSAAWKPPGETPPLHRIQQRPRTCFPAATSICTSTRTAFLSADTRALRATPRPGDRNRRRAVVRRRQRALVPRERLRGDRRARPARGDRRRVRLDAEQPRLLHLRKRPVAGGVARMSTPARLPLALQDRSRAL